MNNVELKDEDFYQFKERCRWHIVHQNRQVGDGCTQGFNESGQQVYACEEIYCPRIKKT